METLAILVAAGKGERMGARRPKAFLELGGETLLLWAARAFDRSPSVDALVVVVPADETEAARQALQPCSKLAGIVVGGPRRQDSVLAGLRHTPEGFEGIVLVHDAARPLVDLETIESVVTTARATGAAVPIVGVADTIKRVHDGQILGTLDRSQLGAAQTPQGFRFRLLARACEEAARDGVEVTDEAMALERLGLPVSAVAGTEHNRKITTPEDMRWAEGAVAVRKLRGDR